ncbi:MAG: NAD(P)/FAD-dependent oxidoreductase [Candidatus Omnitrophota bacterium]
MNPSDITFDIIIIGAGPAGLLTASHLPREKQILLLEKNDSPGRKLLISGSGRCNFTHIGNTDDFFSHYGDNPRFLKTALNTFSNTDAIAFFRKRGLPTTVDKNGKVFPQSDRSRDILDVLIRECQSKGVVIRCNHAVLDLEIIETDAYRFRVKTSRGDFACRKLVIATGGKSYPSTGSTGDGYRFAEKLGHTVTRLKPALTPVFVKNYPFAEISGTSLPHRTVSLYRKNKKINAHTGDIGFTHNGLSGPGILDFSRYIETNDTLKIDFIHRRIQDFTDELIRESEHNGKTTIQTFLKRYAIPSRLISILLQTLTIDPGAQLARITRTMRTGLGESLCEYPFVVEHPGGFDIAMVTAGGIALNEISAQTMESKRMSGLFFAGEIMDIDGHTGGYNIQAAFSTGYLAAQGCRRE